jgi:hypothetical protein
MFHPLYLELVRILFYFRSTPKTVKKYLFFDFFAPKFVTLQLLIFFFQCSISYLGATNAGISVLG